LTFDVKDWPRERLLAQVSYAHEVAPIRQTLRALVDFYEDIRGLGPPDAIFRSLRRGLALAASLYKQPWWSDEKEWRLILWCEEGDHTQFRERAGRLIPYHFIEVPDTFKLKTIRVGPGFEANTERRAVELLRDRYADKSVDVTESEVAYRSG
jgi:hypothetical protein